MFTDFFQQYPEFTLTASAAAEQLESYRGILPDGILRFWEEYGFGSFLNDYLKVVPPWEFSDVLPQVYIPRADRALTLLATGMADLLVWEDGYLVLVNVRRGTCRVVESGFRFFFEDMCDPEFLDTTLDWQPYPEARARLGPLAYSECYGYVPALVAGGADRVDNLQRLRLKEHLWTIGELGGPI